MTLRGMIFDLDGTLVDTNPAHIEAWRRAFQRLGFEVPVERIVPEVGKGGDKLVPSVLGREAEERYGEELRKRQKSEFLEIARRQRFRIFPGTVEIFEALRERGIRTALATSSDEKDLAATQCAMVGDTVYDGEACQAAGVAFLGVLSGPADEQQLYDAGARAVWRDVGHLLSDLDRALAIASLVPAGG